MSGVRSRWLPHVDRRLAVGLALVAVSVLGGSCLYAAADDTVTVLAADRDLSSNQVLARGDLREVRVQVSAGVLDGLVTANDLRSTVGRVILFPIEAGDLIAAASVGDEPRAGRDITVPVEPEHALGGTLRVGDRVDVLASFADDPNDAATVTVVRDAEVVELVRSEGVFGQGDGSLEALTLTVAVDDAVPLAFAVRNAELDVVRSTGSEAPARDRVDRADLG